MITLRSRKYTGFVLEKSMHEKMIEWKKKSRKTTKPLPPGLFPAMIETIAKHFCGFDFMTVPAPSFHNYKNYPIWEVAKKISEETGISIIKLFPEKSGKTKMGQFSSISKKVQDISCDSGKFVLILDDIATTGHTIRVTCEAIICKGSFPCLITFA